MRARFEKLNNLESLFSFSSHKVSVPFFEFFWHFHPELELTLITKGKGNRLVGNSIEPFEKNDFVLLGANLPHVWVSDDNKSDLCEAYVIQFAESFMDNLLRFPEWNSLNCLLKNSRQGLAFEKFSPEEIANFSRQMQHIVENHSLLNLIELLCLLSEKKFKTLSTDIFFAEKPSKDATRLNVVLHFIQMNYLLPVTLADAAASIHLTSSAFSKFFLRKMGKPFTDYLLELRISHACRLLIETDSPVSFVAQASGFENLSYFNRVFLKQKKIPPLGFRRVKEA